MTMSGTARSPWTPCSVSSVALHGRNHVCFGFASCKTGLTRNKARSASLGARPPALPMLVSLAHPSFLFVFFLTSV